MEYNGVTLLSVAGAAVAVLWVSKGALGVLASMPLVSQVLQILGLVYAAELAMDAIKGKRVQLPSWDWKALMPGATPTPAPAPPLVLLTRAPATS